MPDNPLGDFLRARRQAVSPERVGVPDNGRRRSPGLRREELATLAGVSLAYYVRLEQGRDRNPSPQVVTALGRVLGLDEENLLYLARLAGLTPSLGQPRLGAETVQRPLLVLIERMPLPAFLVSRHRDVLAANRPAQTIHPAFQPGENLLRFLFCDARARQRIVNWHEIAETALARLRLDTAGNTDDARFQAVLTELSAASDEFKRLWRSQPIPMRADRGLRLDHPQVGRITLHLERLQVTDAPGQMLYVAVVPTDHDRASLAQNATLDVDWLDLLD